jgi:transcriptional regulator with XRE-family HTH domain
VKHLVKGVCVNRQVEYSTTAAESTQKIGRHLRVVRVWRRLSQEQLSAACSIKQERISKFERDTISPTRQELRALTSGLGVRADAFDDPVFSGLDALSQ